MLSATILVLNVSIVHCTRIPLLRVHVIAMNDFGHREAHLSSDMFVVLAWAEPDMQNICF